MKTCIGLLFVCCLLQITGAAQRVRNPFFGLYSIVSGDSAYKTFDDQVRVMKETGYDGIEISQPGNFPEMKAALDKLHFHGASFYFQVDPGEPLLNPVLKDYIAALKGTGTILTPYIQAGANLPHTPETDMKLIALLRELSAWASASGLQVAIYPHLGFYIQSTRQALELVKQIDRKNTGLSFNLCHWLATTPASERGSLKPLLAEAAPHLRMITICGCNDTVSTRQNIWEDYIMPLGEGSFDTYGLAKYVIRDLHFRGPVGVQCYGLNKDKTWLVKHTMEIWKDYIRRMEAGQ